MAINVTINVSETQGETADLHLAGARSIQSVHDRVADLGSKHDKLVAQMGDEIAPFPPSRIGGYMSHFRIVLELGIPGADSRVLSIVSPLAAQSVSWSDAFTYEGPEARHAIRIPIPRGSTLPDVIAETNFLDKPAQFFEAGRQTLWLQILNLDARMETELGPVRIILGETLKREYPDLFMPSLGVAQSLGDEGFPARLYFNPYAVIETPIGAFRAIHGTLSYGRVTAFPPIGTPISIADCIPLEPVDHVREVMRATSASAAKSVVPTPAGRIVALSHPIDMEMQLSGDDAFQFVERSIAAAAGGAK